jgi:hypothetical protein
MNNTSTINMSDNNSNIVDTISNIDIADNIADNISDLDIKDNIDMVDNHKELLEMYNSILYNQTPSFVSNMLSGNMLRGNMLRGNMLRGNMLSNDNDDNDDNDDNNDNDNDNDNNDINDINDNNEYIFNNLYKNMDPFDSKLEIIVDTNNLIYDEVCSHTISIDQVKDEIDLIKNQIVDLHADIEIIKNKLDEFISIMLIKLKNDT